MSYPVLNKQTHTLLPGCPDAFPFSWIQHCDMAAGRRVVFSLNIKWSVVSSAGLIVWCTAVTLLLHIISNLSGFLRRISFTWFKSFLRKSLQKPVEDRHSESALIQFYCQSYKIHCSAQYVNEFSSTFTPPLQFDHLRHCSTNTSFLSLIFIIPTL